MTTIDRFIAWLYPKVAHRLGMVDEPWYGWLNALANRVTLWQHPEKVTHRGDLHPDKTLYVIHDFPNDTGLASWYDKILGYVRHARARGWTPVIAPSKPEEHPFGDWYTYFESVSAINPSELDAARNVVVATNLATIYKRYNRREIARRHETSAQVRMNAVTMRFIRERFATELGSSAKGLIGAYYRGTDYRARGNWRPVGHAVVPDVDVFCERLLADARRWNVALDEGSALFIVTEEQEALEAICRRFPRCHFVTKERFSNFKCERNVCQSRLNATSPLENNRLYLLDLYILSQCDYLVGTVNGGLLMALNLNGNAYKAVDILNFGVN